MSYCTRADLEGRLGASTVAVLGDADQDGTEDATSLALAIGDVDARIDGTLAVRWPDYVGLPSRVLTAIAVDLVAWQVARGMARSEELSDRAEAADKQLAEMAAGRLHPAPQAPGQRPATVQGRAYISSQPRRLTRDSLGGVI